MRDFHRERRIVWYILLIEYVIILYTIHVIYHVPLARYLGEVGVFLLILVGTRLMNTKFAAQCSNFMQGAVTITCGMAGYLCYSLESGSDRLMPVCIFFVLAECTIYKNVQLNVYVAAMDFFLFLITRIFSGVHVIHNNYSQIEAAFILLLMLMVSCLMIYMQRQDLFT